MFLRVVRKKMTNEREIFYLDRNSSTNEVSDLIFFIKLQTSFVHGILHFIHSLSEEEVFPIVVQIIRESIPGNVSEQKHNEFYKKFWKNVIIKSDEKDIQVVGFYLEIIGGESKIPLHLFSQEV